MRIGFRATTKQLVFRNSKNIKNPKLQNSPKHIQKYLDMFKELLEHFKMISKFSKVFSSIPE